VTEPLRALRAARSATGDFLRRVYVKADQDKIFFMAGAIAFNVLVAIVPLALAAIGITGMILQQRYQAAAGERLVGYLLQALPPVGPDFTTDIASKLGILLANSLNVGLTIVLNILADFSVVVIGMPAYRLRQNIVFPIIAFVSLWIMFLLIYRYLPARRIQWRTALIAASFAAILFEVLKQAFAWYVNNFAEFNSTYGSFAFVAIVVIYVYYMSIVFILGGEVAQIAALLLFGRRQLELLV